MPAIELHNISKAYRLGQADPTGRSFREAVVDTLAAPLRRLRQLGEATGDDAFWALRDVCFEIEEGEVVGLIGRNGAGKSTLLKVLSRIVEPTSGRVILRGRVGSLLEVGTGFHPELTGRENIYLNGAILGMRKKEIDRKFDEIVAFAEIEKFLDTAVKRYSSGMYVRLAFAVAAHLDPEILIVDEVLAVGDVQFQKKCLGKMGEVAKSGRTVVFVSHNASAVSALCSRAIWLGGGQVVRSGAARPVLDEYLQQIAPRMQGSLNLSEISRQGCAGRVARLRRLVLNNGGPLRHGEPLSIHVEFETRAPASGVAIGIGFSTMEGLRLVSMDTDFPSDERPSLPAGGVYTAICNLDRLDLQPGGYLLDVAIRSGESANYDYLPGCGYVEVFPGRVTPSLIYAAGPGVRLPARWSEIIAGDSELTGVSECSGA